MATMPTSTAGRSNRRPRRPDVESGFTLAEIMVVVFILSVMAGLTLTTLSPDMFRSDLRNGSRKLATAVSRAREKAILKREDWALELNLNRGTWISGPASELRIPDERQVFASDSGQQEDGPEKPEHDPRDSLDGDVRFVAVELEGSTPRTAGLVTLIFTPKGLTLPAAITIGEKDEEPVTLHVFSFRPRVELHQGYRKLQWLKNES